MDCDEQQETGDQIQKSGARRKKPINEGSPRISSGKFPMEYRPSPVKTLYSAFIATRSAKVAVCRIALVLAGESA